MKRFSFVAVFVILLALLAAPLAFGQALHNQWFKLSIGIKGFMVDSAGELTSLVCGCENYMHLFWDTDRYAYRMFDHSGVEITGPLSTTLTTIGADENLVVKLETRFARDANHIDSYHTSYIKIKRDSQGVLKKATFTSLGCEVHDGLIGGQDFYGGCTIKGKTIEYGKLPFNPPPP